MFDFKQWIEHFKTHRGYNDTEAVISGPSKPNWVVLGAHKLTQAEWSGPGTIFIDVLCKQWDRDRQRAINWDWRHNNRPKSLIVDKPDNEVADLFRSNRAISLWIQGGHKIEWLDNGSYFVVFQEYDPANEPEEPDPTPDPEPDPEPEPEEPQPPPTENTLHIMAHMTANITMTSNKARLLRFIEAIPADEQGNIVWSVAAKSL